MKITSQQGRVRLQIDVTAELVHRDWMEEGGCAGDEELGNYEVVESCDDDGDDVEYVSLIDALPPDLMDKVRAAILAAAKRGKFDSELQYSAEQAEMVDVS